MLKAGKTRAEIYIGNTIEYDVKSSEVKVTILKRAEMRSKILTVNRSQKNRSHGEQVCNATKQTYIKSNH